MNDLLRMFGGDNTLIIILVILGILLFTGNGCDFFNDDSLIFIIVLGVIFFCLCGPNLFGKST